MRKFNVICLILLLGFLLPKIYAFALSVNENNLADQKIAATIEKGANVLDLSEFKYLRSIPERAFQIKDLNRLDISQTRITDIEKLSNFTELEHLNIRQTRVSDIASLTKLNKLFSLDIGATRVFDLAPLADIPSLNRLQMDRTFIQSLCPLKDAENLNWLNLYSSFSKDGSQDCFNELEKSIDEIGGGNSYRQNYIPGTTYLALIAFDRFFEMFEWKNIYKAIQ